MWHNVHHTASRLARKGRAWRHAPRAVLSANVCLDSQSATAGTASPSAAILWSAPERISLNYHLPLLFSHFIHVLNLFRILITSVFSLFLLSAINKSHLLFSFVMKSNGFMHLSWTIMDLSCKILISCISNTFYSLKWHNYYTRALSDY